MAVSPPPRFITPPDEKELVYPYRRVWPSLIAEGVAAFSLVAISFIVFSIFDVTLPTAITPFLNIGFALVPFIVWAIASLLREQAVPEPRRRLLTVLIVTALVANALSLPFIESVFQPERWLPLESAIARIVGYTFTVGVVQALSMYVVVRYVAWEEAFRDRADALAYAAAAAVGYATVASLRIALFEPLTPGIMAVTVFNNYAVSIAASLLIAYGLGEVRFGQPSPFLMTVMFALAALLIGLVIPLRLGLANASFTLAGGSASPLFGAVLSATILFGVGLLIAFLYSTVERRLREAAPRET